MPEINATDVTIPIGIASSAAFDQSPIADAVKHSLAAALAGVGSSHITVTHIEHTNGPQAALQLSTTGLAVKYIITLPPETAAVVKQASAHMALPDVVISSEVSLQSFTCFHMKVRMFKVRMFKVRMI